MKRVIRRCLGWLLFGISNAVGFITFFLGTGLAPVWPRARYLRWLALPWAAMRKVNAGADAMARRYAEELLRLAMLNYRDDGLYGNAVHKAHIVLGRVALREGNVSQAKGHLLQAGQTPGSPQLDSAGPNMTLARDLLLAGEREGVLDYFALCSEFWETDFGSLDYWTWQVRQGEMPSFGGNLLY